MLEKLADPDPSPWAQREDVDDEDANSWLATFPLIQELQSSEIDVWRHAALAEIDVEDAREWLKKHGEQMEVDERETLEGFVRAADTSRAGRAIRFAEGKEEAHQAVGPRGQNSGAFVKARKASETGHQRPEASEDHPRIQ
ncbi:MAG: hypothetical protein M3198_11940 [Actinomycetota bacterium]|nr:hypothetical protein [Actinomycetota bacterium]